MQESIFAKKQFLHPGTKQNGALHSGTDPYAIFVLENIIIRITFILSEITVFPTWQRVSILLNI